MNFWKTVNLHHVENSSSAGEPNSIWWVNEYSYTRNETLVPVHTNHHLFFQTNSWHLLTVFKREVMRFSTLDSKKRRVCRQTWWGAVRLSFRLTRLESSGCWLEGGKKQNTVSASICFLGEGERNLPDLVLTPRNWDFIIPNLFYPCSLCTSEAQWDGSNVMCADVLLCS